MSSSPTRFLIRLLSPVSRLSFALHSPAITMQSAGTWSPRDKMMTSSRTSSSSAISARTPPRTQQAFEPATMESRSVVFLERTSCTIPMMVLQTMMKMNTAFFTEPVSRTRTASATFIALNSVQTFS